MSFPNLGSATQTMLGFLRGQIAQSKGAPEIDIAAGDSPADCKRKLANGALLKQGADPARRDQLRSQRELAMIKAYDSRGNKENNEAWWRVAFQISGVLAYTKAIAIKLGWRQPEEEKQQ